MRRKKERSKQGQTNKQGKATQHTQGSHFSELHVHVGLCIVLYSNIYMCSVVIVLLSQVQDELGRRLPQ